MTTLREAFEAYADFNWVYFVGPDRVVRWSGSGPAAARELPAVYDESGMVLCFTYALRPWPEQVELLVETEWGPGKVLLVDGPYRQAPP